MSRISFINRCYSKNEFISFPSCGADKKDCIDESKQFTIQDPNFRNRLRQGYNCPCDSKYSVKNISTRSVKRLDVIEADQILETIENSFNPKDQMKEFNSLTKRNIAPMSEHLECPWIALRDPLWAAVGHYLYLMDIPGTTNINSSTDNIVYEAVMYYKKQEAKLESYLAKKQYDKTEADRRKKAIPSGPMFGGNR